MDCGVLLLQVLKAPVENRRDSLRCGAICAISKLLWVKFGGKFGDHVLLHQPLEAFHYDGSESYGGHLGRLLGVLKALE